ncbi:ABC transporter permease [Tenacibaculum sediminilitoris]|uniref:MlaD family protein n=1 Tax=Tenacibaculum sediminilitoris TaxID=1820334 RepID=UPI003895C49D
MKKTNSQKFRLGLFVSIGTIIFLVVIYLIGQRQSMFKKNFTISAYFQNVNGLQNGNNVRYSGIDIGTVKEITMINDSTIKVDMVIDKKIAGHIHKDAVATIGSDGLVGNMLVNIVSGERLETAISNGDVIKSSNKLGTDDILNTLNITNKNAAKLTVDLLKITNKLLEGKGALGVLLNDTLLAKDLKQSVDNLKKVSQGASNTVNELNHMIVSLKTNDDTVLGMLMNDTISGNKLKTVVANLEVSSSKVDSLIGNINVLVRDVNSSKGAFNYITKDTSLVNSLKSTLKNINEGTEKFNENMEAFKHNFLTRGYFRKLEKEKKKAEKKSNN